MNNKGSKKYKRIIFVLTLTIILVIAGIWIFYYIREQSYMNMKEFLQSEYFYDTNKNEYWIKDGIIKSDVFNLPEVKFYEGNYTVNPNKIEKYTCVRFVSHSDYCVFFFDDRTEDFQPNSTVTFKVTPEEPLQVIHILSEYSNSIPDTNFSSILINKTFKDGNMKLNFNFTEIKDFFPFPMAYWDTIEMKVGKADGTTDPFILTIHRLNGTQIGEVNFLEGGSEGNKNIQQQQNMINGDYLEIEYNNSLSGSYLMFSYQGIRFGYEEIP